MIRTLWALAIGFLLALPVAAQEAAQDEEAARDEREAVAAEYREAFLAAADLDAMVVPMAQPLLNEIARVQPDVWEEKGDAITEIVTAYMRRNVEQSMEGMDAKMAEVFSMEELVALRDFYASDVGQAVMSKMPAFMAEVMPKVMEDAMGDIKSLLDQLEAEGVKL